jgi:16S rRNA C967 or C1407 C5-methylase (RsmB/RsmF family)
MKNTGLLISNDFTGDRMKPLGLNIQRMGITNAIMTKMYGQWFSRKNIFFDRILVDAPCSGTGAIRKSLKTLTIWNPLMIKRLAVTQKKLLASAFEILKENCTLVYSTCSTEPEENEGVISFLLDTYKNARIEDIKLNIKKSEPILEFEDQKYHDDVKNCLRIWPQDNDTEGFFVARIRKTNI